MKFVLALLAGLSIHASASAASIKGNKMADTAKAVVSNLFGRAGDQVHLTFVKSTTTPDSKVDTWQVHLSNGASVGSASYEVEISYKTGGSEEGAEVATVKVKYLAGT